MAKLNKVSGQMLKDVVGFLNDNPKWLWENYSIGNQDFKTWLGTSSGRGLSKMLGKAEDAEGAAHRLCARMTGKDKPDDVGDIASMLD